MEGTLMKTLRDRTERIKNRFVGCDKQGGYVLAAATIFAFILLVGGMTLFSIATGESRNAHYDQRSWEAFYLADSALERARAHMLSDVGWRDGWTDISAGNGTYSLSITDTTYAGVANAVRMLAVGQVDDATRQVEMIAAVSPSVFSHTIVVVGEIETWGNVCIEGLIFVGVDDGGYSPAADCGDIMTDTQVTPPAFYTDSAHFPGATYYDVRATEIAGTWQARILDGDGNDITSAVGDSLVGIVSYDPSADENDQIIYRFNGLGTVQDYFHEDTGVFKRNAGDTSVVVNFGNGSVTSPPGVDSEADVLLDGVNYQTIHTTIINTKFTGITEEERQDTANWSGGDINMRKVSIAPYNGIAFISHEVEKDDGTDINLGTETWPALVVITGEGENLNPHFKVTGTVVCLGEWSCFGDQILVYDPGYLDNLPTYLVEIESNNVSGRIEVLLWQEL
jgi:hypothetical protein